MNQEHPSVRRISENKSGLAFHEVSHTFYVPRTRTHLEVCRDISFLVHPMQFVSLVGPSGCGKSTLLRIAAGLVKPTTGTATLDGERIQGPSRQGMVFQQDALFPWLSVQGNIEFGLRMKGVPAAKRREVAVRYAQVVGLDDFLNALPKELSGGMRKRVDIARVYANNPDVLLMDEPFGSLDAITKFRMQDLLVGIWDRERKTVLFVTHDLDEAIYLGDIVLFMTARPGHIAHSLQVDIKRPRVPAVRVSDEFFDLKRKAMAWMEESIA